MFHFIRFISGVDEMFEIYVSGKYIGHSNRFFNYEQHSTCDCLAYQEIKKMFGLILPLW